MWKILLIPFLFLVISLAACQPGIGVPSTQPSNKAGHPAPSAPALVLSTSTLIETPAYLPTLEMDQTPTQSIPSSQPITPTGAIDLSTLLKKFPLNKGTSWTWTNTGYSQAENDPYKIIHGSSQVIETVADIQNSPPFYIAHIRGSKTMLSADPGWQENGRFDLGEYEYWHVLRDGQVYLSYARPDLTIFPAGQLDLLEYQFPMAPGAAWCPDWQTEKYLKPPVETPFPCQFAGMRTIENIESVQTQAGNFKQCYRMTDAINSGGVTQWFCDGVGIVAQKYDHAGSQFGFKQDLVKYNIEPPNTPLPAITNHPIATASPGQASSFNYDPNLFSSSIAELLPAVKPGNDVPLQGILPQRAVFTLLGYPIISHLFKPQIFIYPAAEFKSLSSNAAAEIANLQILLKNKPNKVRTVPFLPFFEAAQQIHAQMKYMDFKNGRGVRFLTQYDQALLSINNNELIYTFQGLTDDGKWYVSAVLPVNHPSLPADGRVTPTQAAVFERDFPGYIAETTELLNNQPDASFRPDLSRLDALLSSLEVQ